MAWFVVIGNGAYASHKVEAEKHVVHRKGVAFYNGTELVAEFPGPEVFRVMTCASEAEADAAIESIHTHHRGNAGGGRQDVAKQLRERSARRKQAATKA